MIDVNSVSDFNLHFVSQFSSKAFLVAGRFFDLAPDKFDWYACEWYGRHGFGELKDDRYVGQLPNGRDAIRYHSVDSLILEAPKELSPMGQHLWDNWQARKASLAKYRNEPPPVIVLPPNPNPPPVSKEPDSAYDAHPNMPKPPKAKPVELPPQEPKPEPKKQRSETVIKLGVWLTVLTPVMMAVSFFIPPPWNVVAKAIFEAIKLLIGG